MDRHDAASIASTAQTWVIDLMESLDELPGWLAERNRSDIKAVHETLITIEDSFLNDEEI